MTHAYNTRIDPIIRSLVAARIEERMPMFVSVATKNGDGETLYESRVVLGAAPVRLSDNRIRRYILSLRKIGESQLPPDVRAALDVIEKYAGSVKAVSESSGSGPVGVNLKDDLMDGFCSVAGGGDKVVV